jgi:phage terminase small subunit
MPTPVKANEVIQNGGGKHWTKEQLAAREQAANLIKRKKPKTINAPASLSTGAKAVWKRVLNSVEGIDLLDNMDTELLEAYCETVAKSRALSKKATLDADETKAYQAYVRIIKSLANELGLSPASRARLVKKKADEIEDTFSKFDR